MSITCHPTSKDKQKTPLALMQISRIQKKPTCWHKRDSQPHNRYPDAVKYCPNAIQYRTSDTWHAGQFLSYTKETYSLGQKRPINTEKILIHYKYK